MAMFEKKEPETQRPYPTAVARVDAAPVSTAHSSSSVTAPGRAANIGTSLFIKGEVSGSEDLTVEGHVEGKIDLKDHKLTIAQSGRVSAEIHAKTVTIVGELNGNVHADERVEIAETGRLVGDLCAPRIVISDGAQFRGSVDMGRTPGTREATVSREPIISREPIVAREGSGVRERIQQPVASQVKVAGQA
jgi:cytoskeletal protein CcmA (bactofilin family)